MAETRSLIYTAPLLRQVRNVLGMVFGFGLVALMIAGGARGSQALWLALPGLFIGFGSLVSALQRTTVKIDQDLVRTTKWPFGGEKEITRKSAEVRVDVKTDYDFETQTTTTFYTLLLVGAGRGGESIRVKLATGNAVHRLSSELRAALAAVAPREKPGGPPAMLEVPAGEGIATDAVLSVRVDTKADAYSERAEEADAIDDAIARAEAEERGEISRPPRTFKSWKK